MIRVLIVEDSAVVMEFLEHVLTADAEIQIVGRASDGEQAVELAAHLRPDVVTMDIHMPRLDGIEATRRIMETFPVPIIIVSGSTDPQEVALTFRATEAGAVAVLRRPAGLGHPDHDATARELVQTVKGMAEVKVIRRWPRGRFEPAPRVIVEIGRPPGREIGIVGIGASTGGPPVVHTILAALPHDFPAPILIVQHMARGFIEGFSEWLGQGSALPVHVAAHAEMIRRGHVYLAPDDHQMTVSNGGRIALARSPEVNGLRPAVASLFRSILAVHGDAVVAGLLSGMGRDGAEELKLLRQAGAITFVQDRESSVVHGMPGEALRLDAASYVLAPEQIAGALIAFANNRVKGRSR